MNEPKRVPIKFWGQDKPAPEIAWDRIENALAGAYTYWLSTVSAVGVPQPRPVWGMRFDGRMLLTVGSTTVWRNVERDPHASVHLESASEVVILEGTVARVEDDDLLARFLTPYNAKYRWNLTRDQLAGTLELRPHVVLSWIATPLDSSPGGESLFPRAASKWVWD